ncbi:MAG: SRPBCC family protein [Paracoccaceae bacterium]
MKAPTFTLSRHFDAPPELVWQCWTDKDLLQRWYGPGMETHIHAFDPVPGGVWLNEMILEGTSMYQRMDYHVVEAPSRLVLMMANADANWDIIASPMIPNWPRQLRTEVSLLVDGAGTEMTLEWSPHEASAAENATFDAAIPRLDQGWTAGFDIMEEILREITTPNA